MAGNSCHSFFYKERLQIMLFRYDFDNKLDLSRFKKQAAHYIRSMPEITYHLVVNDYKMVFDIRKTKVTSDSAEAADHNFVTALQIFDLKRDSDHEISESKIVFPMNDPRFQEMEDFIKIFPVDKATGEYLTKNADELIEKMSDFMKMLNKLNRLKAFF